MNQKIRELAEQAGFQSIVRGDHIVFDISTKENLKEFAELIVKEMCDMMEQAEDDCYHCFEPSERPTEYISWLNEWRTRFEQHFTVKE